MNGDVPRIRTKGVLFFLFFPFNYWNRYIEPKKYKGIYGSESFYKKFNYFFKRVDSAIRKNFPDKSVHFINRPLLSAHYRDKLAVKKMMVNKAIPTPKLYKIKKPTGIYKHLSRGRSLFLKSRYGSMGKGITLVSPSQWKTNFVFRNRRILSRKSDYGWRFRDITGRRLFLEKLFKSDIYVEEAVDFLMLKGRKFDLRVYTFFDKALFVYPKSNEPESVTTNISQDGRGEYPAFLRSIPRPLINRVKKEALRAALSSGLNFAGVDVMVGNNLRDIYIIDINAFPGFPRKKIFNLAKHLTRHLKNSTTFRYL